MNRFVPIALLFFALPVIADEIDPLTAPPAIAEVTPSDATETITVPKAEYERLRQENEALKGENNRLSRRRSQLVLENERLAAELGMWKSRLERVFQCSTIQEAIEELRAVLVGQGQ